MQLEAGGGRVRFRRLGNVALVACRVITVRDRAGHRNPVRRATGGGGNPRHGHRQEPHQQPDREEAAEAAGVA